MKKLLIIASFVIATAVVVATFMTAKTYTQLAIASAIYPAIAYLGFRIFSDISSKTRPNKQIARIQPKPTTESKPQKQGTTVLDIDKRAFLKLIGGAGLSFFLFSLFARKAEDVFLPKSAQVQPDLGSGGVSANQGQPADGYRISEIDDSDLTFYGFINKEGAWFIMREDPTSGTFRYAKGDNDFPGAWSKRKALQYDYYHNLF